MPWVARTSGRIGAIALDRTTTGIGDMAATVGASDQILGHGGLIEALGHASET